MGFIGLLQPSFDDEVSEFLLQQIGSGYRREARQASKKIVSEIYSPPRVTAELKRLQGKYRKLAPGYAMDLTTTDPLDGKPWDFSFLEKRERARRMLRRQKPYMLIGSPMCRAFSTWQFLNAFKAVNPEVVEKARKEAVEHLKFVVSLYYEQIEGGRHFLHEHPLGSTSWQIAEVADLAEVPGVTRVRGDQCQYGAEVARGEHLGDPIMKPTRFMTSSEEVGKALSKTCQNDGGRCSRPAGGFHRLCSGQHAADAAKYPRGLCRAILSGINAQLTQDDLLKNGCFGIQVPDDDAAVLKSMFGPAQGYSGRYRDDLTGQVLRDDLVRQARAKELAYFHEKGVWVKISRAAAQARSGRRPISVRWVDVNKGDEVSPNYRSNSSRGKSRRSTVPAKHTLLLHLRLRR